MIIKLNLITKMLFKQHIIRTGFQRQENSVFLNLREETTITKTAENVPTHFDWDDCGITIFGNFPSVSC